MIISNYFFDTYIDLYLLVVICLVTALLHYTLQPYNREYKALSKSDAFILLLLAGTCRMLAKYFSFKWICNGSICQNYLVFVLFPIKAHIMAMGCIKVFSKYTDHDNEEEFENYYLL